MSTGRYAQDRTFSCYKSRKVQMCTLGQPALGTPGALFANWFIHSMTQLTPEMAGS